MTEQELREIKMAWARGEMVQYRYKGVWMNWAPTDMLDLSFHSVWRIAPKTIIINGYEVPEPLRDLRDGQKYYSVSLFGPVGEDYYADGCLLSKAAASMGLLHDTREAAELHAKALLSFTEQEQ